MSYYYLISSLSMPILGEKLPQTLEQFMVSCSNWLSGSEYRELDNISLIPDYEKLSKNRIVNRWKNWETCLRNRFAKIRSDNLQKNASAFFQEEKDVFSEIDKGVQEAYSAENPLLKEKALDKLRWKELDNMESGNKFNLEILCIYKLRLMLSEKWITRESEQGERNLDATLLKFYSPENEEVISDQQGQLLGVPNMTKKIK